MNQDELITVTQAAEMLGVTRQTIHRRITAGLLNTYESGRDRRATYLSKAEVTASLAPVQKAQ